MSVNVTQHKPSFDERLGKGFVDYAKRYEITVDDLTAGVLKIPVNPGEVVIGVRALVLEAFNNTPTLKVGDGADDDGFILTTDIDLTAQGALVNSQMLAHNATDVWTPNAYSNGKAFLSGGALVVTIGGTPDTGKLALSVIFDGYGVGPDPRREIKNL